LWLTRNNFVFNIVEIDSPDVGIFRLMSFMQRGHLGEGGWQDKDRAGDPPFEAAATILAI
jgi:hypothetical protein